VSFPFRLFFLVVGIYGVLVVLAWMFYLFGGVTLPLGWSPVHWHSHEMLFGLVSAAIAGFILTAVCNWTSTPPLAGKKLLLLGSLWLAGRVAFWLAGWLPLWLVMLLDMLFLPALGIILLRVLLASGNKRNLMLGAMILALALANLSMHIGFITGGTQWLQQGEMLALNLITLIMVVIGGRIIPLFTANWLRNKGVAHQPIVLPLLDKAGLISVALLIPADMLGLPWLIATIALIAGALQAWRWLNWQGWRTVSEPLLWILHLGYGWLVIALLLKGVANCGLVAPSASLHALGTGAIGTLILGVMTRVALGHTGRPFQLPTLGWLIYVGISLAAVCRVAAALGWVDYRLGLMVAATGWCFAFVLFVILYWPILSRPRVDGRPG
jgi:uncharacterized protein involved in response to NO